MKIKLDSGYLEFNDDIEIDRSIKLWDDVSTVNGDFSYTFEIPNTKYNRNLLNIKSLNGDLSFSSSRIDAFVESDSGKQIRQGFIRIENVSSDISLSFFAGNSDWFEILNKPIQDYRIKHLDKQTTAANIVSSWTKSNGIVYPFVDRGGLTNRKSQAYHTSDFQPFVYVRDAINAILGTDGIKLKGSILNDALYNSMITTNNVSDEDLSIRSIAQKVYVGKSSNQIVLTGTDTVVVFNNLSGQYYNSQNQNFESGQSRYVFSEPTKRFNVKYKIRLSGTESTILHQFTVFIWYNNGSVAADSRYINIAGNNTQDISLDLDNVNFNVSVNPTLNGVNAGDFIDIRISYTGASATFRIGSELEVTPLKFDTIHAEELLPRKNANEFLADTFRLINGFCSYNALSKELTVDTIDAVLNRTPIDISGMIDKKTDNNFDEFISNYAKINLMVYQEDSLDEVTDYNKRNPIPYGGGALVIDNNFLEAKSTLIDSDFTASWHNDYTFLNSLPHLQYVEMEAIEERVITSVTDNGDGYARFNWATGGVVGTGIVRISESSLSNYNGDFDVIVNNASYVVCRNVFYAGNATATLEKLNWVEQENDSQVILCNVPSIPIYEFAGVTSIVGPDSSSHSTVAMAYFCYPRNGTIFSSRKLQCLSFDAEILSDQLGLKEVYYSKTEKILNKNLLLRAQGYIPESIEIDFLTPFKINTDDINGSFLLNRQVGYKNSYTACELELIKL